MSARPQHPAPPGGHLPLNADDLAACVACGLCLAHCPTFRVSGEERLSPRGRIAAMRAVYAGEPAGSEFEEIIDTCVQCRACETACPSSVPFGHLMEDTRSALAERGGSAARRSATLVQRAALSVLTRRRLLVAFTSVGAVAQRLRIMPGPLARRLALPGLPVRQAPLRATGTDVWLFTGCVMDAWQRRIHLAAIRVVGACGAGVALPGRGATCCGALHTHAGQRADALRLAVAVMASMPGDAPILMDSAGCGAAMKDYGRLVGTAEAQRFSRRVLDIHEWLAANADRLPPPVAGPRPRVAVQDPCHLRHVQRAEASVRTVLSRYADLVELSDDGRCCGAGGAYSVMQPRLARLIRDQKVGVIEAAGADYVASANPGCSIWLGAAGIDARHPVEIVAEAAGLEVF